MALSTFRGELDVHSEWMKENDVPKLTGILQTHALNYTLEEGTVWWLKVSGTVTAENRNQIYDLTGLE